MFQGNGSRAELAVSVLLGITLVYLVRFPTCTHNNTWGSVIVNTSAEFQSCLRASAPCTFGPVPKNIRASMCVCTLSETGHGSRNTALTEWRTHFCMSLIYTSTVILGHIRLQPRAHRCIAGVVNIPPAAVVRLNSLFCAAIDLGFNRTLRVVQVHFHGQADDR